MQLWPTILRRNVHLANSIRKLFPRSHINSILTIIKKATVQEIDRIQIFLSEILQMKLVVFGATGKTGQEIVKQSLSQGCKVTAFVRDPSKMTLEHGDLKIMKGDIYEFTAVK